MSFNSRRTSVPDTALCSLPAKLFSDPESEVGWEEWRTSLTVICFYASSTCVVKLFLSILSRRKARWYQIVNCIRIHSFTWSVSFIAVNTQDFKSSIIPSCRFAQGRGILLCYAPISECIFPSPGWWSLCPLDLFPLQNQLRIQLFSLFWCSAAAPPLRVMMEHEEAERMVSNW